MPHAHFAAIKYLRTVLYNTTLQYNKYTFEGEPVTSSSDRLKYYK